MQNKATPPHPAFPHIENQLLARLSAEDLTRIRQELVPVFWKAERILLEQTAVIRQVWFPATSVVSLGVAVRPGLTCEAAIVGSYGIVGYEVFLGNEAALSRQVVQIGGVAYQLPLRTARAIFNDSTTFRRAVLSHISALHAEILQSAACHGLHSGRTRLARLLLQMQDCADGNPVLKLTHKTLANALGVQRTTISAVAIELQQEGLIAYRRGRIGILRRDRLEHAACECYRVIRANFEHFQPRSVELRQEGQASPRRPAGYRSHGLR